MKRIYGAQNTHLNLSEKAEYFYDGAQPLTIIEHEDEDENLNTIYLYSICETEWNMTAPVSENEMVQFLEAMNDIK